MAGQRFNVERTPAGQQLVIPGTEKPRPAPKARYAKDGSQLVIPGAEQVSPKTHLTPYGQIICPTDAPSRRLTMIVAQEPTQSLATPHRPLAATIEEIAAAEKINSSYVSRLLRVTLLAPTTTGMSRPLLKL